MAEALVTALSVVEATSTHRVGVPPVRPRRLLDREAVGELAPGRHRTLRHADHPVVREGVGHLEPVPVQRQPGGRERVPQGSGQDVALLNVKGWSDERRVLLLSVERIVAAGADEGGGDVLRQRLPQPRVGRPPVVDGRVRGEGAQEGRVPDASIEAEGTDDAAAGRGGGRCRTEEGAGQEEVRGMGRPLHDMHK